MRIVVTEYPKSGGSWLTNLIADAIGFPKRDIYVNNGYNLFEITKHPWYENSSELGLTESCVIKSHELPNSPLIDFDASYIHLIRDGRDVVVSRYFYERDFCVQNGIYESFDIPFEEYVEKTASEWLAFVMAWEQENVYTAKYEDLLADAYTILISIFDYLKIPVTHEKIAKSVNDNSFDKMRKALDKTFRYNTFCRKGVAGDWRHHFTEGNKRTFKRVAGDTLIKLGYETDYDW